MTAELTVLKFALVFPLVLAGSALVFMLIWMLWSETQAERREAQRAERRRRDREGISALDRLWEDS